MNGQTTIGYLTPLIIVFCPPWTVCACDDVEEVIYNYQVDKGGAQNFV